MARLISHPSKTVHLVSVLIVASFIAICVQYIIFLLLLIYYMTFFSHFSPPCYYKKFCRLIRNDVYWVLNLGIKLSITIHICNKIYIYAMKYMHKLNIHNMLTHT